VTVVAGATKYLANSGPLDVTSWSEDIPIYEGKTIEELGGWSAVLRNELKAHNTFIHVGDVGKQEVNE
jgi:hypothetical protein